MIHYVVCMFYCRSIESIPDYERMHRISCPAHDCKFVRDISCHCYVISSHSPVSFTSCLAICVGWLFVASVWNWELTGGNKFLCRPQFIVLVLTGRRS